MDWFKVSDPVEDKLPFIKRIKVKGKIICLVGYGGEIFAVGSTCPHAGADLSGGWCKDGKIICPFHRYSYDIKTGKGDPGQNDYIDTYPAKLTEDGVYVGLRSLAAKLKNLFK